MYQVSQTEIANVLDQYSQRIVDTKGNRLKKSLPNCMASST